MGGSEMMRRMRPTNERRIPVFLEISSTDWCVCDATSRLNMRSPTKSHSLRNTQFTVSRYLDARQLNRCL